MPTSAKVVSSGACRLWLERPEISQGLECPAATRHRCALTVTARHPQPGRAAVEVATPPIGCLLLRERGVAVSPALQIRLSCGVTNCSPCWKMGSREPTALR